MCPVGMVVENKGVVPNHINKTNESSFLGTLAHHGSWWYNKIVSLFSSQDSNPSQSLVVARQVATVFNKQETIKNHILDYLTVVPSEEDVEKLCEFPIINGSFIANTPMSQFDDYMRAQRQATDYKLIKCAETYFWFLEVDASIYVRQEIEDFRQIESAKECFKNSPLVLRELVQTVISDEGCEPKLVFEHLCELNWFEKAKDIIKKVRAAMETVAVKNSKNYQEFCKVRKRSFKVQFHSEEVHLRLKETGFCMNPKMLTPDGVHCFECKSSFFGFRPWHDPSKLHNHTIKHRSDAEYLKRTDVVYIGNKQDQESI